MNLTRVYGHPGCQRKEANENTHTVTSGSSSEPPSLNWRENAHGSLWLAHTCPTNTCKNKEKLQKSHLRVRQARLSWMLIIFVHSSFWKESQWDLCNLVQHSKSSKIWSLMVWCDTHTTADQYTLLITTGQSPLHLCDLQNVESWILDLSLWILKWQNYTTIFLQFWHAYHKYFTFQM